MLSQGQTQYRTSHGFEVSTSKAKKWQSHSVSIMYGHCIWVQSLSPLSLIFEVRLLEFLCYHCNSVLNRISSIFWEESIECIALQKKVNQGNSVCSPSSSIPFFFLESSMVRKCRLCFLKLSHHLTRRSPLVQFWLYLGYHRGLYQDFWDIWKEWTFKS